MTVFVLAWIGFTTAIIAASILAILQAVDGIALKRAVDLGHCTCWRENGCI